MAGRHRNPDTDFKVILHVHRSYRYAATQPYEPDPKNPGRMRRRYVFWGTVTEDLRFIPNERYLHASREKRNRLIFPENWDMSESEKALSEESFRSEAAVGSGQAGGFALPSGTAPMSEQQRSRLYGGPWLLWEIARERGLIADLYAAFPSSGDALIHDIMTVVMHQLLSGGNGSIGAWQRLVRAPSEHPLLESDIRDLTRLVTDWNLSELFRLRMDRQKISSFAACFSEVRAAPAGISGLFHAYGSGQASTTAAVLYALPSCEPVYCRLFHRGESVPVMLEKIRSVLVSYCFFEEDVIPVIGYESAGSVEEMAGRGMKFLAFSRTGESIVSECLGKIRFDRTGLPSDMEYFSGYDVWCSQSEQRLAEGGTQQSALRVSLLLDMNERLRVITDMYTEDDRVMEKLESRDGRQVSDEELQSLGRGLRWHILRRGFDGAPVSEPRREEMDRTLLTAGFIPLVSSGLDADAKEILDIIAAEEGQKQYSDDVMRHGVPGMQGSSGNSREAGRILIRFISLILRERIQRIWRHTLRGQGFASPEAVFDEMASIRYIEGSDGGGRITAFTDSQKTICAAFSLTPPADARSQTEAADAGKKAGRRVGRPRGSINRPKPESEA